MAQLVVEHPPDPRIAIRKRHQPVEPEDFTALGKGLNDNTAKLGSAVESLYGRAAGTSSRTCGPTTWTP